MTPAEACAVKRRYAKRSEAESAATRYTRRNAYGHRLRPYQCPLCGEWHLTKRGRW